MEGTKTTNKEIAICIFGYNRYKHLKVTLEKLFEQDLKNYDLYFFQDGPKNNEDKKSTDQVREYINSVYAHKFKKTKFRNANIGLANSVFYGLDQVFKDYEKVIVLEDDILVKNNFLDFITLGLSHFSENEKVAGISGFSYMNKPMSVNYFLPIGCSWGWATWRRVWGNVKRSPLQYQNEILKNNRKSEFDFGTYPFYNILENAVNGKNDSWAINFYASFFLKDQLFLYPNISLCDNVGFDGSGTHTGISQRKFNSNLNLELYINTMPLAETDGYVLKVLKKRMKIMAGHDRQSILRNYLKRFLK